MKRHLSTRQLINIELAAREENKNVSNTLKRHIPPEEQAAAKIMFICECSDPECVERVPLTIQEYDELHKKFAQFVIVKGHQEPKVEKLKATEDGLAVVEKYAL